jgi:deazaflavin-dependent oxidoreductase (nitroreductase family)
MTIKVTPRGTLGAKPSRMPAQLMTLLQRPFAAMVRRPGSKMRVAGQPLLVLKTIGASSGRGRQAVLGYWPDEGADDGSIFIIGSNIGVAVHPGWLFNMARHPDQVWIERAGTHTRVQPETLEGEERAAVWTNIVARNAHYGRYQEMTDREIPIVRLRPIKESATTPSR